MKDIFNEEKKYLEYVKENLEEEKEYYKKEMKEIPKRHNNVLQGDTFLVEDLMSSAASRLKKLELSENSPYFGRIDFLSNGSNNITKVYIGKTTIHGKNNETITTDWRTPICSLYYDSELGEANYKTPTDTIYGDLKLKRQIIIKNGDLIDVLDTSLVSNDELLQPYLSINADNKMKTIIASIQKEQNKIIREPISKNIIVQGVAGSGKTSVALHRVAYLVYILGNKINTNQILSIGPNKYFLNYVSAILPELEIEPIDQKTYLDLANNILKEKYTLYNQSEIFNDEKNTKEIDKRIDAFKSSLDYKDALSKFMQNYLDSKIVQNGIIIDGEEIYSADFIKKLLFSNIKSHPNYEMACNRIIKDFKENIEEIYKKLNEKYRQIYINLPQDDERREEAIKKSNELSIIVKKNGLKLIKDYFKNIKLKPIDIYKLFVSEISQYTTLLSKDEILNLQERTLELLNKKKVSFEDLPALMYINYSLYNEIGQYKHIVIDEAQDYGLFHFDILKEIFPNSTFSIYGDLAQSIYSHRSIKNWESVVSDVFKDNCEILNLSKSYRTTIEITNNANKILNQMNLKEANPVIRHGEKTSFSNCSKNDDYKIKKISQWLDKGYKTIAIICKTDKEAKTLFGRLQKKGINITQITAKDEEYKGGVFVLTSALSKGLEFDAVMINDASNNIYSQDSLTDMHLLYVACTRALHELDISFDKNLCSVFNNLEDENINSNDTSINNRIETLKQVREELVNNTPESNISIQKQKIKIN